ncbi:type-F conjugative transfer system pilin assembly protein TrbC [Asticcacaulis sp.]|uniref:type-F conjugative transfer system pilin assembly protein TrbC n=1 Tax=Asticcacaulis sp. TaxID=1872648 RepID=UPI002607C0AA|nr:type-F conjugative transfer system pilin assembly protein TrbC [Asticcacaulis sp.]
MLRALKLLAAGLAIVASNVAAGQDSPQDFVNQILRQHPQALRDATELHEALKDLTVQGQADGVGLNGIDLGALVDTSAIGSGAAADRARMPAILIFVSSSMPPPSIKAAATQARRAGGAVVMRGLVDNSLTKTAAFLAEAFGDQAKELGLLVDPRLFATYRVDAVPAVVVSAVGPIMCEGEPGCEGLPDYDRIAGDVSLQFALEAIADAGGPGAPKASEGLARIKRDE